MRNRSISSGNTKMYIIKSFASVAPKNRLFLSSRNRFVKTSMAHGVCVWVSRRSLTLSSVTHSLSQTFKLLPIPDPFGLLIIVVQKMIEQFTLKCIISTRVINEGVLPGTWQHSAVWYTATLIRFLFKNCNASVGRIKIRYNKTTEWRQSFSFQINLTSAKPKKKHPLDNFFIFF